MQSTVSIETRKDAETSLASTHDTAPIDGGHACEYCQKTFRRPEHLKRHIKSHTSPRAHVCSVCGKQFARSDVLQKHEFVHRSADRAQTAERSHSRACIACARARERCTRGEPCGRCASRSINCEYRRLSKAQERRQSDAGKTSVRTTEPENGSMIMPSPRDTPGRNGILHDADDNPSASSTRTTHTENRDQRYQDETIRARTLQPTAHNSWRADHQAQLLGLTTPSIISYPQLAGLGTVPGMNWLPVNDEWDLNSTSVLDLGMNGDFTSPAEGVSLPNFLSTANQAASNASGADTAPRSRPSGSISVASVLPDTPSTKSSNRSADRGNLYATSSSARTTAYQRDKARHPFISGAHAQVPISKLLQNDSPGYPTQESSIHGLTPQNLPETESARSVWATTFDRVVQELHGLKSRTSELTRLANDGFPTLQQFDMLVGLFFSRFLPSLPILHETLAGSNDYWALTLAMATIGCHYTKTEEFDKMVVPFHEFLSSALMQEATKQWEPAAELRYVQASLLSQVGLMYYGPTEMRHRASLGHGSLVRRAEDLGLFSASPGHWINGTPCNVAQAAPATDPVTRWHNWVYQETARRLGYAIWTLGIMWSYHFSTRSLLPAQLPQADLPHDGLWAAANEHEWSLILGRTERNPPLAQAIRRLYVDREIKPDVGEFSRIVALHGLYHEIQQVRSYYERPLSTWVPSAPGSLDQQTPGIDDTVSVTETETYSAWRNASLDCVDVLHWWANGMIALQSGMENTTVFHLHMSRVVLLVPIDEILVLIQSMTYRAGGGGPEMSASAAQKAESEVLRWAHRDESKARLVAIHSGCVWWHLRRFSIGAFYEARSIYLATLTLWAYSYYVSRPSVNAGTLPSNAEDDSESESSSEPEFIWIDRPNDDEMVQFFVRSGRPDRVKAFVAGVGDIYEPQGPAKILKEGLRIIEKVAFPWGRESEYVRTLQIASRIMTNAQEQDV